MPWGLDRPEELWAPGERDTCGSHSGGPSKCGKGSVVCSVGLLGGEDVSKVSAMRQPDVPWWWVLECMCDGRASVCVQSPVCL